MKLRIALALVVGCLLVAAGPVLAEKKHAKEWKAVCPVSGKAATHSVSTDYKGAKVYLCCPACVEPFNKDTAKYAAKANHQLVVTGQAEQKACPLTGREVNPEKNAEVAGVKVCFCCGGCLGKVAKASADEQLDMVFGKGFDQGFKVKEAKSE